jgi:hypothetical protein
MTPHNSIFICNSNLKTFLLSFIRMGIINNDVYECSNGVQKAGTYISFATETIYLVQTSSSMPFPMPDQTIPSSSERNYNVRANYRIFWDQATREAGKSFIDLKSVNVVLTAQQLDSNIYQVLYEELKKVYPNTSDEFRAVVPVESAPAAPVVPVADAPVESAPAAVVPAADAPAESAPAADAPAESAPVADAPAESAPAADAPAESAPAADAPAESAPAADAPAESAPVADAPAESAPVESAPADAPSN